MANEEHIQILMQGVEVWNRWREDNSTIPDLSEANLFMANLGGANLVDAKLIRANLSGASLVWAKLIRADLSGANLTGTYLGGANLSEAKLIEANLDGAYLIGADLIGAKLIEANLNWAYLTGAYLGVANLREAKLIEADLSNADLRNTNLSMANLSGANLIEAKLTGAKLIEAEMNRAYLIEANLIRANLIGANLSGANLIEAEMIGSDMNGAYLIGAYLGGANLSEANLSGADLSGADLIEANLIGSQLINTKVEGAFLTDCQVYGISAWGLKGIPKDQSNLIITRDDEPIITVDNLEVAQFIYLLLHSQKIRYAIDTIAKKAVLILGRFTPERMVVLNAIRDGLRKQGYLPILFYFERPESRDFIETVSTLAHISRFVVADVTDPRIVIEEVPHIVHNVAVPVKPLLFEGSENHELVTLGNLRINHRSLLKTFEYKNLEHLLTNFKTEVIDPAEQTAEELYLRRIEELAHPKAA